MKAQVVCMPWPLQRWVSVVMLVASLGAIVFAQPARTEDLHPYLEKAQAHRGWVLAGE